MEIKQIKTIDAASFVNLIKQVESESAFMLLEKGERNIGPEQQEIHYFLLLQK